MSSVTSPPRIRARMLVALMPQQRQRRPLSIVSMSQHSTACYSPRPHRIVGLVMTVTKLVAAVAAESVVAAMASAAALVAMALGVEQRSVAAVAAGRLRPCYGMKLFAMVVVVLAVVFCLDWMNCVVLAEPPLFKSHTKMH